MILDPSHYRGAFQDCTLFVYICMYSVAYFSDLDGAFYFCKLLFCTWSLARVGAFDQSGGHAASCFLFHQPIRILANESHAFISHPFWPWANQRACFWWEQPSWMLRLGQSDSNFWREHKW